jgi:myosin heavy subunit
MILHFFVLGNRFASVGSTFSRQLSDLMATLQQTTPYFIRCASPNNTQSQHKFIWTYVKPQLRCGGLVEGISQTTPIVSSCLLEWRLLVLIHLPH